VSHICVLQTRIDELLTSCALSSRCRSSALHLDITIARNAVQLFSLKSVLKSTIYRRLSHCDSSVHSSLSDSRLSDLDCVHRVSLLLSDTLWTLDLTVPYSLLRIDRTRPLMTVLI
jgi:hypothetical protein